MRLLVLLAFVAAALPSTHAGCYRGRPRPPKPTLEESPWRWRPAREPKKGLPEAFSWADVKGRSMITPNWNQHEPVYCGSCFAHATLTMLGDRLKIEKGGIAPDTMLSRQSFLNCAPPKNFSGGCNGGDVIEVLRYMREYGLPDETCLTYTATDSTKWGLDVPSCPPSGFCTNCMPVDGADTCWAVKTPIIYRTASYGTIGKQGAALGVNERAMQAEILARGPIVCSIATPDDFTYGYRGGVYVDPANYTRDDVDHDVELIGWGIDDESTPYWIVRNSWGSFWGENGFIRVPRGTNALYIEDGDCWGATLDWSMEQDFRAGKLVGTMWGVVPAEGAKDATSHLVKAAWAV